ncbi:MAG: glycosyltransferase family 4 protein [Cyanobacteria bacterium P01_A01_bin.84]
MPKQLRILYAIGPENIVEAYKYWKQNKDAPSQVSLPYSSQFYEVCRSLNAKGYAIAQSEEKQIIKDPQFIIERRTVPLKNVSGILYHLREVWCGLILLLDAIRFNANVAIISSGTTHWFMLWLFSRFGIDVIPSLHCVLWHKYLPTSLANKMQLALSRNVFAFESKGILAVSHDIAQQVTQLTDGKHPKILQFFPTFRPSYFADIALPSTRSPFKILFAGRIEENKGVFDLLEIAKCLKSEGKKDIIFDICGEGSVLEALKEEITQAELENSFICHGYCTKAKMREMFSNAHVVIVPTRKDFVEGFNRVVGESILCGRPVITSAVCPALSYVKQAVMEVPPNDVQAYKDALLALYNDSQLYEEKRLACLQLQQQFYDQSKSWGSNLKSILIAIDKQK